MFSLFREIRVAPFPKQNQLFFQHNVFVVSGNPRRSIPETKENKISFFDIQPALGVQSFSFGLAADSSKAKALDSKSTGFFYREK